MRAAPPEPRPPLVARRGFWLALAIPALALTVAALGPASRLGVTSSLEDLLPAGLEEAEGHRLVQQRFGGLDRVYIVVEGEGLADDDLAEATAAIADELGEAPELAWVRSGPTPDDERFVQRTVLPRAPFLVELDPDVVERMLTAEAIRERVALLRDTALSPTGPFEVPWLAADPLGFAAQVTVAVEGPAEASGDPMAEAMLSADGTAALIVAAPVSGTLDGGLGRAILDRLARAREVVSADLGVALVTHTVGGPVYAAHDEHAVRRDVVRGVVGSAIGVAALLIVCFGGLRVPAILVIAVGAGVLWTAAVLQFFRGEISGVGLSFASVLIGLGVDYGIHGATRFTERRAAGRPAPRAMSEAFGAIAPAVLVSVLTTAAAFLVLANARLRPVAELGGAVGIGIVLLLLASVGIGASLLVLVSGNGSTVTAGRGLLWRRLEGAASASARLGRRHPGPVLLLAAACTVAAIFGLGGLSFDVDLRQLRPADGAIAEAERKLVEGFGQHLDTTRILVGGRDLDEVLDAAYRVQRVVRDHAGAVVTVRSPADWLPAPAESEARLRVLMAAPLRPGLQLFRDELERAGFDPAAEAFEPALTILDRAARGEPPPAVPPGSLPEWLGEVLAVGAERAYAVVRVDAVAGKWPAGPPDTLIDALRAADPDVVVVSVPRLGTALRDLAASELRRLGGWSVLAALLIVFASFRGRPVPALMALAPVALGALWTLGLWGWLGIPLTLLSVALAPLILGIGIDDGLHALHGSGGPDGIAGSVTRAGRAMILTTLTTGLGFAGLAFSSIPALRGAALLVATGTLICLGVTLVGLPALARWTEPAPRRPSTGGAAPQAPEVGRLGRWLGAIGVTGVFWYRLHAWGVRILPERLLGPFILLFTSFFFVTLIRIRGAIAANLEAPLGRCGPVERQRRIWRTMHAFAWCLSERYERLGKADDALDFRFAAENAAAWERAADAGRGVVLVTGHIGNWEVGSSLPATREARHVHLVREREMDPRAQAMIARLLAERMGPRYTTHFATDDPRLGLELLEALNRGEVVALQGDRPRASGKTVTATLFERPYRLPVGPLALARTARAAIVPAFVLREGRLAYTVVFGDPIRVARSADRQRDLLEAGQRFTVELERVIRRAPHQWFCFRELWPGVVGRPAASGSAVAANPTVRSGAP